MKTTKTLRTSPSYHLEVPIDLSIELDGKIWSMWRDNEPLLLQLSSYIRNEGSQVPARERLVDRMSKLTRKWSVWEKPIHLDIALDQATAEFTDEKGLHWIYAYLVWPHLTVFITISGPHEDVNNHSNWALEAVRSIKLTTQ